MKKYMIIGGVFLSGLLLTWIFAHPEQVEMVWKEKSGEDTVRDISVMPAEEYIEHVVEDLPGSDEDRTGIKKNIADWEKRILDFGKNGHLASAGDREVRRLAEKTVRLLHILKEAKDRQQQGLEPYTAISGFNTMALIMTIEKDFKNQLGFSFSDFFKDQDPEILKRALD